MTAQVHERLILDGEHCSMACCPRLPEAHPRVRAWRRGEPRNSAEEDYWGINSTACWRQYVGTWEIRDGKLFLVALLGRYRLVGSEPLLADWFTGVLYVPRGEVLEYVHMGFESVFERELQIGIVDGHVVKRQTLDNRTGLIEG
jgi:hypothetical protein